MKLSESTIGILQNFANIYNGIAVKAGNQLKTISPNKTIVATAKVSENFPSPFCIYDLSQFLSTLSLFDSPELTFDEKFVTVSDSSAKVKYVFADPNTIVTVPDKSLSVEKDIAFRLPAAVLSKVMKSANVLGLPNLVISSGKGENTVVIKSTDIKNSTSNELTIDIAKADCYTVPDNEFSMVFKIENLKLKTGSDMDYQVEISKKGIARFHTGNLEYFIVSETNSSKFVA